jgi:hypothetical protein
LAGFSPVELNPKEGVDSLPKMPKKNPSSISLSKMGSGGGTSVDGTSAVTFIELNIQVDAPIIVLPSDSADPTSAVVVLDLGKVVVVNEPNPCYELIKGAHSSPYAEDEEEGSTRLKRDWRMRAWKAQLASVRVLAGSTVGFWRAEHSSFNSSTKTSTALSSHILIDEFSIDIQTAHAISLPLSSNTPSSSMNLDHDDDGEDSIVDRVALEDGAMLRRDIISAVLHGMVLHVDPSHLARLRKVRRAHIFNKEETSTNTKKKKKSKPYARVASPAPLPPPTTTPPPSHHHHRASSPPPPSSGGSSRTRSRGSSVSKRPRGRTGSGDVGIETTSSSSTGRYSRTLYSYAFVTRVETVEVRVKSGVESPVATLKVQGIDSLGVAQRGGAARMEGSLRSIEVSTLVPPPCHVSPCCVVAILFL